MSTSRIVSTAGEGTVRMNRPPGRSRSKGPLDHLRLVARRDVLHDRQHRDGVEGPRLVRRVGRERAGQQPVAVALGGPFERRVEPDALP